MTTDPEERPATLSAAQAAFVRYEGVLRRLGAVGEIGVGFDPDAPVLVRWWARCLLRREGGLPEPVLVVGMPSGFDALGALVETAAQRAQPTPPPSPC